MSEKLRKTLELISDKCGDWLYAKDVRSPEDVIAELHKLADEALAEPLKNCDRFNTPDEALSTYCEEKGITHPLPLWFGNEFWGLLQWLFAKAEREAIK